MCFVFLAKKETHFECHGRQEQVISRDRTSPDLHLRPHAQALVSLGQYSTQAIFRIFISTGELQCGEERAEANVDRPVSLESSVKVIGCFRYKSFLRLLPHALL